MFVTLLLATFDGQSGRLTYVRAGHVPPFLRRAAGTVERLTVAGGLPLGLMEEAVHVPATVELAPGDELLIVTDGITEAHSPERELFGEGRVTDLVAQSRPSEASLLLQLRTHVQEFEAGSPQSDDIAAILLRRL